MQTFDYPLCLEPIYVPRPWGGRRLQELYGRDLPDGRIGESWELSDWPMEGDLVTSTRITNGPLAGITLDDLFSPFPVVVKLLDAHETLSIQAHPVPGCCEINGKPADSKNEMWYILYAEPGAFLYLGLKEGIRAAEFCDILKSKPPEERIIQMINQVPVKAGTHLNVPSGTLHAVGAGIVAFEVSQRTQVTYRLYDWNRKPERQLHLEDGCKAIIARESWEPGVGLDPHLEVDGGSLETITSFPSFAVSVYSAYNGTLNVKRAPRSHILTPIDSSLEFTSGSQLWQDVRVSKGSSVLAPASPEGYQAKASGRTLITTI